MQQVAKVSRVKPHSSIGESVCAILCVLLCFLGTRGGILKPSTFTGLQGLVLLNEGLITM